MDASLHQIVSSYNDQSPLDQAFTIPAPWYVDERVASLERLNVFGRAWQVVARADQVRDPGQFVTTQLAGEPLVLVCGTDNRLRAFYNVCRHHAAAVVPEPDGAMASMARSKARRSSRAFAASIARKTGWFRFRWIVGNSLCSSILIRKLSRSRSFWVD